ncbi:WGR domain-containing protein, partial [Roseibium sp. RKSG952]|nr:WGR domain-containing protein [Roseibium sp. RKSG952]
MTTGTLQELAQMTSHMIRQDPARNMDRFYTLELRADLFGGIRLERRWGRTGTRGQSLCR